MEIIRHKPTPEQEAMNKEIDDAYRRGDDAKVDDLLRTKLARARQAADSPDTGRAA